MLNYIWLGLLVLSVILGAHNGVLPAVTARSFEMARYSIIEVALPLAGFMTLWLGMMRLAERAGLMQLVARALRPMLTRLFPDVPASHPAMGSMLMNMAANMLGLGNAATPLGLRAMKDLESLNPRPGTATNAMCMFLAINTSSIQLIPATAMGILATAGSKNPAAIVGTAFLATIFSTLAAIVAAIFLARLGCFRLPPVENRPQPSEPVSSIGGSVESTAPAEPAPIAWWGWLVLAAYFILFLAAFMGWTRRGGVLSSGMSQSGPFAYAVDLVSQMAIPFLLSFLPLYAALRCIPVYEEFVEGAKEGIQMALRILPYLVAILVAVGMFRAAGGIDALSGLLGPVLALVHFPPDLLPLALVRPFSGSGSLGIFTELVKQFGPDALITRMAGTLFGSTETTFYVLAVYFGSVGIRRTRHALAAGLIADAVGVIASVIVCTLVFGK
jgi:spore maturation protein SpmA